MFHKNLVRQAQVLADAAHLVLKEVPQGFDQGKWHIFRQPADVVVRLDSCRGPFDGDRLDDVRVEGSLDQQANFAVRFAALKLLGFFREHRDEFPANDFAFLLGVSDALQFVEEAVGGIHADDVETEPVAQHFESLFEFVLSQHPGVHKNIRKPVPMARCTSTAATVESTPPLSAQIAAIVPTLARTARGGFFDERRAAPFGSALQTLKEEISQQFRPALGVVYFRMELHRVNFALRIFHGGDGIFRAPGCAKSCGQHAHMVSMTVPYAQRFRDAGKEF